MGDKNGIGAGADGHNPAGDKLEMSRTHVHYIRGWDNRRSPLAANSENRALSLAVFFLALAVVFVLAWWELR